MDLRTSLAGFDTDHVRTAPSLSEALLNALVGEEETPNTESQEAFAENDRAVIGSVIERHRASQQNPLIARAGSLFATLTGGAFNGLGHDYDERDMPVLVGHRNSGGIGTGGMSDGTRDQLYLALRLAYLENYARQAEPAPFICDDLFTTFDDTRTANALMKLAGIGELVQPILFTHHKHVIDIARAHIGAEVDVVHLE